MKLKFYSLCVLFALNGAALADSPYYNPANAASSTGKTIGYELYNTIGCPGKALLDPGCQQPSPAPAPVPAAEPAPVAAVAPAPMDSDQDGVPDNLDQCPDTPKGVKVDAKGCPLDSDADGVPDYLDQCPDTPKGVKVDAKGCPLDSDADGVPDYLDQCPDTPKGVKVDAKGCPLDSDADGVPDNLDQCPDTPKGVKVDAKGCSLDSDADGVPDNLDQCPDTPAGEKVDAKGCPLFKGELKGVNFDNDKSDLRIDALMILNLDALTLKQYPDIKVEVGGYTDSRNTDQYNLGLGQRRAEAVVDYLVSQGIAPARLIAKSYGESQPIADNETEAGRIANRRVELKIIE
jgi:OOP family OmpA-OmpF porin